MINRMPLRLATIPPQPSLKFLIGFSRNGGPRICGTRTGPSIGLDVEEDLIESRHPHLTIFYFEWHDNYETSFKSQECDLGSDADVFPDVEELVAWATEGFLMACWLALQDNVTEVEYEPMDDS